jgi:predicted peroxiredoxin
MFKRIILIIALLFSSTLVAKEVVDNSHKSTIKKKTLSGKKLMIVVSSGDLQQAGMGFALALSGVKQGAEVTILIGADALKYALADGEQNVYFAKARTPRKLLQDALKSGASIQLCSANTEVMGWDEEDFIEDVKIVISTEIFAKVFADGTKVISF